MLGLVTVFGLSLAACGNSQGQSNAEDNRNLVNDPYTAQEMMLGTIVNLTVYDEGGQEAIDVTLDRIAELDGMFSMTDENSEIYEINENAGVEPVQVSDEVFHVMEESVYYAELSDGLFDPTVGTVTDLWGIGQEDAGVPTESEIEEAVSLVDYEKIELNEEDQTVYLEEEGMMLDLGAIAKGYITDQAIQTLVDNGVTTGIADLGGDLYVLGDSHRGVDTPWRVGIQNPFAGSGEIVGMVPVKNESVVTSGIYERFIEDDEGNQYHHIMNPETGKPVDNELAGLSLVAPDAITGDGLSTAVFSMGVEQGLEFVNNLNGIEAIFITKDQEIYLSDGYESEFELTDNSFELANVD